MRTIAKETKEIVLEHVTHVSCDRCGKTVENSGKPADVIAIQMIHDFAIRFNYGSEFDNDTWRFDICEDCLLDYVATFRHAPQGFREVDGETFDDWKRKRLATKLRKEDE